MSNHPYIILTMKWGTAYTAEDVNKVYGMVHRHLSKPFQLICFTDDPRGIREEVTVYPLPDIPVPPPHQVSPWRKLAMFQPQLLEDQQGIALFLDLDLVVVENIDCFFEIGDPQDFHIIENWTQPGQGIGNSSVYRFPLGDFSFIYQSYMKDPLNVCLSYDNEQIFLSRQIVAQGKTLNFWPDEWCRSFKKHCVKNPLKHWFVPPEVPVGAKIIAFHGHPKPQEAMEGMWKGKPWKRFRPARWVQKHWRE